MDILFLVLVGLAGFHFLYEGVILPTIRLRLRYKLFELRDKLRRLKIERGDNLSDEVFSQLQDSINNTICFLHTINLETLKRLHRAIDSDQSLRKEMEKRRNVIETCPLKEVREIDQQHFIVILSVLTGTFGGWVIYVLPPIMVYSLLGKIIGFVKALTLIPEDKVQKFLPAI